MTTRKRTVLIIGLLILVGMTVIHALMVLYQYNVISSTQPRKAKREIPVTYNIGWWPYQDKMKIDNFKVEVVESRLNMFNKKSLLSYTVTGQLKYEGSWKPFIKGVHISERLLPKDTLQIIDAEIRITPIVDVKQDKLINEGTINFEFKNEHTVESMHWGKNTIRWTCRPFEQIVESRQDK